MVHNNHTQASTLDSGSDTDLATDVEEAKIATKVGTKRKATGPATSVPKYVPNLHVSPPH